MKFFSNNLSWDWPQSKQSVYKNFLEKIEEGKQISEILKRKKDLRNYSTTNRALKQSNSRFEKEDKYTENHECFNPKP